MSNKDKKKPHVNIDVLITKNNKVLLGLLSEEWRYKGEKVYGVPGRDIEFGEKFIEAAQRDVAREFDGRITDYDIISVNSNRAYGNHYIGIGILVETEDKLDLSPSEDWEKWEWFSQDEIPNNLFPAAENLLDSYFKGRVCVSE